MTHNDAFHYINKPHEAYVDGYSRLIGTAIVANEELTAYQYFLPLEIINYLRKLSNFYEVLIRDNTIKPYLRRWKSPINVFDIAISLLNKIDHYTKNSTHFLMGRKDRAIAYAFVGPHERNAMARHTFSSFKDVIELYTDMFVAPQATVPIVVYHLPKYREILEKWINPDNRRYRLNALLSGAMSFLYHVIKDCGPDTIELYEYFTNDYQSASHNIDLAQLAKARVCAFNCVDPLAGIKPDRDRQISTKTHYHHAYSSSTVHTPPPPPVPHRTIVTITELVINNCLEEGAAYIVPFDRIPAKGSEEDAIRQQKREIAMACGYGDYNADDCWE